MGTQSASMPMFQHSSSFHGVHEIACRTFERGSLMSWWLGAGLGFLRGGPLGAVIGGAIQHAISKKVLRKADCSLPGVTDPGVFATCMIAVLTRTNLPRGPLTAPQIAIMHKFFRNNFNHGFKELQFVDEVVRETEKWKPDLVPLVQQFTKSC